MVRELAVFRQHILGGIGQGVLRHVFQVSECLLIRHDVGAPITAKVDIGLGNALLEAGDASEKEAKEGKKRPPNARSSLDTAVW